MVILGIILQQLAPLLIPVIVDAISRGVDPNTIDWMDWAKHYGRSTQELEAEVDAQKAGGAPVD